MKVYGASDDLIEFDGQDFRGEVGCYGTDDREKGVLVFLSDGTVLEVKYCKRVDGVWGIDVLHKGKLFEKLDPCTDENDRPYSDIAHFKDGIKWAYAATGAWEEVQ